MTRTPFDELTPQAWHDAMQAKFFAYIHVMDPLVKKMGARGRGAIVNTSSFAFLGDLSHHSVLLLEKPRMEFAYDSDPKMAAATRVKLLDTLAANKTAVMSYHFPWPGYGHVVKAGDGFRYIAEPMIMNL